MRQLSDTPTKGAAMNRRDWGRRVAAGTLAPLAASSRLVRQGGDQDGVLFVHAQKFGGLSEVDGVFAVNLRDNTWRQVSNEGRPYSRVSPDGRWLAFASAGGKDQRKRGVWLLPLDDGAEPKHITDSFGRVHWVNDGERLLISGASSQSDDAEGERGRNDHSTMNRDGGDCKSVDLPANVIVADASADGQWVILEQDDATVDMASFFRPISIARIDGTERKALFSETKYDAAFCRISPNHRDVLYYHFAGTEEQNDLSIEVVGPDRKEPAPLIVEGNDLAPFNACWSPNDAKVAVTMFDRSVKDGRKNDIIRGCRIAIYDVATRSLDASPIEPSTGPMWMIGWCPST